MNRLYESMTRASCWDHIVRVWREEPTFRSGPDEEIARLLQNVRLERLKGVLEVSRISQVLDALDRIAAYEILDQNGHGVVVYPDWK